MSTKTAKPSIQIPVIGGTSSKDTISLPSDLFGQKPHAYALTQYIQMYRVNARQGNASTKDRSQVVATTKKMYKQKGTGNARHGSAKAPIFVGGGVVGGPKPKDYHLDMNKKQKTLAFVSALSQRAADKTVAVLAKDSKTPVQKTKEILKLLSDFADAKSITLVVSAHGDEHIRRAAGNVKKIHITTVQTLNPYAILSGAQLVFTDNSLSELIKKSQS